MSISPAYINNSPAGTENERRRFQYKESTPFHLLLKTLSIGIVAKDRFAAVTAAHHVDGVGIVDAQLAGRDGR